MAPLNAASHVTPDKEVIKSGVIYIAPPNYHLLIENNFTFSLSVGERVNYAKPSIDILFQSASEVYSTHLIGILLTGASADGALGIKSIK